MQFLTRPSRFLKILSRPALLPGLFLISSFGLLACAAGATPVSQSSPTPQPTATPAMAEKPAPIENVYIEVSAKVSGEVSGAGPAQADLVVESGLPNACYTFGHHRLIREADTFRVEIVNLMPDDPMLACAEIYGMITTRIPLPGEVETCKFYDVVVNDNPYSVQAIAPNARCAGPEYGSDPWPSDSVVLPFGEKTPIAGTNLALTLIEVPEDSRCPRDVVCVWAGRATVVLGVELDGKDSGNISLGIEGGGIAGGSGDRSETVGGHTIELLELEPYPVSTGQIPMEEYSARVLVTGG
jgi:hypothetical protein